MCVWHISKSAAYTDRYRLGPICLRAKHLTLVPARCCCCCCVRVEEANSHSSSSINNIEVSPQSVQFLEVSLSDMCVCVCCVCVRTGTSSLLEQFCAVFHISVVSVYAFGSLKSVRVVSARRFWLFNFSDKFLLDSFFVFVFFCVLFWINVPVRERV